MECDLSVFSILQNKIAYDLRNFVKKNLKYKSNTNYAGMVEMADTLDLGSNAARRAGSSPVTSTIYGVYEVRLICRLQTILMLKSGTTQVLLKPCKKY